MSRLNRGYEYRERVGAAGQGRDVLDWLTSRYAHADREEWRARIAAGEVEVDGRAAEPEHRLSQGEILVWRRPPWLEPDVPLDWELLHEDAHLLGVGKPSGLPTVPAGGLFYEHTLLMRVRERFPEATPMHRLGRGTSGVVLFARTAMARASLQSAFRERRIEKIYRALVCGLPERDAFTVELAIGPVAHARLGTVHAALPTGRPSTSHVEVLQRRGDEALVEVRIDTGRPHQIRIHLAAIGHPLVGDPLYAPGGAVSDAALPGDEGYLLHACSLAFEHPRTGARTVIASEPPQPLRR